MQNNQEICRIPLEEIIRATKEFSSESQVGEGGFGMVYKGQLSEHWKHHVVAIKRLNRDSFQGDKEFNKEVEMVSKFKHQNIIPFVGYYNDANEKIIVYDYATNGSLDHHLQNPNKRRCLTWVQRLKICLGAAKGIKYLHSGVGEYTRVIHRDVKSANILLDDNLEAKICDFGLSRISPRNQPNTHVRTKAYGTRFYIDPIYNERGRLSKESDIYSFGVVMFEMSSGMMVYNPRRFEDAKEQYLIDLVRSYYDDHELVGGLDKLIDTNIKSEIDLSSFQIFNEIAHECIDMDSKKRPTIDRIIQKIEEALHIQSFQITTEISRDKVITLKGKDLYIAWGNDTRYWELVNKPPRILEAYVLKRVWWLDINGKIAAGKLVRKVTYVAYLIFQTFDKYSMGLNIPVKTRISNGGIKIDTENVYLQRPQHVKENYVLPFPLKKGGWMAIKLGEFEYINDGEVDIELWETNTRNEKRGLLLAGMLVRPK